MYPRFAVGRWCSTGGYDSRRGPPRVPVIRYVRIYDTLLIRMSRGAGWYRGIWDTGEKTEAQKYNTCSHTSYMYVIKTTRNHETQHRVNKFGAFAPAGGPEVHVMK